MTGKPLWGSAAHVHCGSSGGKLLAAAFGEGSTIKPVEIGGGLYAAVRTSEDGASHVLCVHNGKREPIAFLPGAHLPGDPADQIVFVRGETVTRVRGQDIECVIEPGSHVWLGRVSR